MSQAIILDRQTAKNLISAISELKSEITLLRRTLVAQKPKYGSEEWWEESTKQALKDIENGDYVELNSKQELNAYLSSL